MLYLLISMIIMLAFLDKALRVEPLKLADLTLRYKLFSARDRLRLSLIKGETEYNKWFQYFDTTLTRTIHNVKDVNPVLGTVAMLQFKKHPVIDAAYHQFEAALLLPENRQIGKAYRQYIEGIGEYLTVRHRFSLRIMIFVMVMMDKMSASHPNDIHASSDPRKSGESVAPIFSLHPQTSTMLRYNIGQDVYQSGAGVHMSM